MLLNPSFFEKCGQLFFSRMRLVFFYLLALIPWALIGSALALEKAQLRELEEEFFQTVLKEKPALKRKLLKKRFLERHGASDPYFLDRNIESLGFLHKEQEQLSFLLTHPALAHKQTVEARLEFLSGSDNRLSFKEENVRTSSQIKETEEKQRHPIQLDQHDLAILLSRIEDCPIGAHLPLQSSPQLIIRDFKLKKIKTPLQTESFELELELLNREFLR